jgi:hypothetical protein
MQNIQKHHKSAEILKNNEENNQELRNPAVVNEDDDEKVKNCEKNPVGEAKNGLEDESFFTVINRARKAAHTVSEKDIWGSD